MSLKVLKKFTKKISFRLTVWYSGIFFISSLILFGLTYFLISSALKEYDRDIVRYTLIELSIIYEEGGIEDLKEAINIDMNSTKKDPLFIRISNDKNETVFINIPFFLKELDLRALKKINLLNKDEWLSLPLKNKQTIFEISTIGLLDGNFLQVGKSNKDRERILLHFRKIFAIVIFPLIFLGLSCGAFLAINALKPIRHLIQAIQSIINGKFEARVVSPQTGDEIDELVKLFNGMIEKIETLIKVMRSSLDNVAHDLRTPMARLRVGAEMALQSKEDLNLYREALSGCIEESDQIMKMLNTLMDISEAETGTMKMNLEVIDFSIIIDETVEVYRYLAEEKNIMIETNVPKSLSLRVDSNRIKQVIGNLLDNAIKYTPDGGKIEIKAYKEENYTILAVKDTGIGIPPEDLHKIWDRLFRGDKSRSQRGLGLGLSLVKAIVEAHGGKVEVISKPNIGSTFKIYIPSDNN